ncbi:glutathione S-transferase family protein [Pelagimonas varians]|uniref:Glutathionine S-transferase n=1 Tax=Pelagimonas varians TaxID=696760 RepID=A0A238K6D4_9RHOB|nr:glutathione S-transferase family protein [Pelagimonas varians]PYG30424.1 glutathione S-transferase [Pelagimonas varians]SMX37662.1 glutathionine S-transferase [Pelagimonas varians]
MSYKLFGAAQSRTFRVMWMLEELGQSYEQLPVKPHDPALLSVSSLGKIPVLQDGEDVIPDSTAILTYLADKHEALTSPAGTAARGQQDAMTFRILDDIETQLWTAARHSFVLPEEDRVPAVKETCKKEYLRSVTKLMEDMDGPYVMGEKFSVPDIILTHIAGWALSAKFPEPPEAFAAYLKRTRGRDAFKAARNRG